MKSLLFASVMSVGLALGGCRSASREAIPAKIEAAKVGIHYDLIGVCGLPLGEPFEIEGSFVQDTGPWGDPGYGSLLSISAINGKKLRSPVEIDVASSERRRWRRPIGTTFHLRVLEWADFDSFAPINVGTPSPAENPVRKQAKPDDGKMLQQMHLYLHVLADLGAAGR